MNHSGFANRESDTCKLEPSRLHAGCRSGEGCEGCDEQHRHLVEKHIGTPDEALPVAVWEGTIMGMRCVVLNDGRRVIDADDLAAFFDRMGEDGMSVQDILDEAEDLKAFLEGRTMPSGGTDRG